MIDALHDSRCRCAINSGAVRQRRARHARRGRHVRRVHHLFPLGYRDDRPDFGIVELELSDRPLNTLDVEQAIEAYEPRADVRVIEQPYDPNDPLAARVRVEVSIARSQED
jgi:phage baseplate assembly protein W